MKHISSKVSNGLRLLYLARKLTYNQETLKLFTIHLSSRSLNIVMLYGVTRFQDTRWQIAKLAK